MDIKQLDVPIRDFDTNGYDDIEFIPKERVETVAVIDEVKAEPVEEHQQELALMDGRSLLHYFLNRFKEVHGYPYKPDYVKELKIFESFKSRYGSDAGHMVRVLFDNHQGKLAETNGVITPTAFTKNAKWIQDMLYCEVQEEQKKTVKHESSEGLMTSDDFIRLFQMAK